MKELLAVFCVWCLACAIVSGTRHTGDAMASGDNDNLQQRADEMNAEAIIAIGRAEAADRDR
jgi:hypothetical protein